MRMASAISRTLRHTFFSRVRNICRASCWVMVLAPWSARPRRRSAQAAAGIRSRSIPSWSSNRRSSNATTACRRCGETSASGTSMRYSRKIVKTGRSLTSYSVVACGMSPIARSASRPGSLANTTQMETTRVRAIAPQPQNIGRRWACSHCDICSPRSHSSYICATEFGGHE